MGNNFGAWHFLGLGTVRISEHAVAQPCLATLSSRGVENGWEKGDDVFKRIKHATASWNFELSIWTHKKKKQPPKLTSPAAPPPSRPHWLWPPLTLPATINQPTFIFQIWPEAAKLLSYKLLVDAWFLSFLMRSISLTDLVPNSVRASHLQHGPDLQLLWPVFGCSYRK